MKKKIILVAMIIVTAIAAVGCGSKNEAVPSTIMNQPTQSENVFSDITSFDALVTETLIEPMEEHTETTENRSDEDETERRLDELYLTWSEVMIFLLRIFMVLIVPFSIFGYILFSLFGRSKKKDKKGIEAVEMSKEKQEAEEK